MNELKVHQRQWFRLFLCSWQHGELAWKSWSEDRDRGSRVGMRQREWSEHGTEGVDWGWDRGSGQVREEWTRVNEAQYLQTHPRIEKFSFTFKDSFEDGLYLCEKWLSKSTLAPTVLAKATAWLGVEWPNSIAFSPRESSCVASWTTTSQLLKNHKNRLINDKKNELYCLKPYQV